MDANEAAVWMAGIAAAGSVAASLISALVLRQTKATHAEVDGRMSELLEATRGRSDAEGHAAGRAEKKAEMVAEEVPDGHRPPSPRSDEGRGPRDGTE